MTVYNFLTVANFLTLAAGGLTLYAAYREHTRKPHFGYLLIAGAIGIIGSVWSASTNAELEDRLLGFQTGGDSFAYLDLSNIEKAKRMTPKPILDNRNAITVPIVVHGEFPVRRSEFLISRRSDYDKARIREPSWNKFQAYRASALRIPVGDISPSDERYLQWFILPEANASMEYYLVKALGANPVKTEQQIVLIKQEEKWLVAYKLLNSKTGKELLPAFYDLALDRKQIDWSKFPPHGTLR